MSAKQAPAKYDEDAEVRGKMRQWKTELMRKDEAFDRLYDNRKSSVMPHIEAFATKSSMTGKQRALDKITRMLTPCGVRFEGVQFKPSPLAVYSHVRPRDSIILNAPPNSRLMEDCVTVNYILVGHIASIKGTPGTDPRNIGIAEGHWTLEVPDHAIGRIIHRTRSLPDAIIREAHHNILRMNPSLIQRSAEHTFNPDVRFDLRAGPGGFICTFHCGEEESRHEYMAHVRAETWVPDGHRGFLAGTGLPGARLVDSWLIPAPMRLMWREDEREVRLHIIQPLPELTYRP